MPASFLVPINLNKNELQNARIHNLSTAPSSPVTGQPYYDTDDNDMLFWDGSGWVSMSGGVPADATTGSKGIVQLAGDLGGAGTAAAAPIISANAITATKVAAALKPSGTAAAGDESLRALGTSASTALAGNTRLDQIAAPTASVVLNSQKITGLADGTAAGDAVNRGQLDGAQAGLDTKASVRAATVVAGTLATSFENGDTVDGVALVTGDRILIKDQAAPAENGIYLVAASGAPTRTTDADAWGEIVSAYVFVEEGTNADTGWVSTADAGGTLNTTAMPWTQFTGLGQIVAGAALTKTGATLDVAVDGSSIEVSGDALRVKAAGITETMLADDSVDLDDSQGTVTGTLALGNGGTGQTTAKTARETGLGAAGYYNNSGTHSAGTSIVIAQATHLLRATRALQVQTQIAADGTVVIADVAVDSNGDVTVTFAASQGANTILVSIVG